MFAFALGWVLCMASLLCWCGGLAVLMFSYRRCIYCSYLMLILRVLLSIACLLVYGCWLGFVICLLLCWISILFWLWLHVAWFWLVFCVLVRFWLAVAVRGLVSSVVLNLHLIST